MALREFIRSVIAEKKEEPALSDVIVDFLIRMYAAEPSRIQWHYASFQQHDEKGDWSNVGGMYVSKGMGLLINKDRADIRGLRLKVLDVLHEIQHHNQHMQWESGKAGIDKFMRGKKFPPDATEYDEIYEKSFDDITNFWVKAYGYASAPHEVDARKFANDNIDEAMGFIKKHSL